MTPEERRERARKAAAAQVKKRQAATAKRDPLIIKSFKLLAGIRQPVRDATAAARWLAEHGQPQFAGDNETPETPETPWRILAAATGLTTKRIRQILAEHEKRLLARFPHQMAIFPPAARDGKEPD